jgi:hypothetical protein
MKQQHCESTKVWDERNGEGSGASKRLVSSQLPSKGGCVCVRVRAVGTEVQSKSERELLQKGEARGETMRGVEWDGMGLS